MSQKVNLDSEKTTDKHEYASTLVGPEPVPGTTQSGDKMETSVDDEDESCDCSRCNQCPMDCPCRQILDYYEEPDDPGHLVINLGVEEVNFTKNSNDNYTCPEESCDFASNQSYNLRRHYMKHTGEKPYQCKICDQKFAIKDTCKNHIRTHDDKYKFMCYECGKMYSRKYALKKHIRAQHCTQLSLREREWFWGKGVQLPFW